VTSFNGQPLPAPLAAAFAEPGGTIGRGDTNQLVLADPERYVSRMQARVDFRNGQWLLTNQGANPITLNGERLSNSESRPLKHGDQIRIGAYALQVEGGVPAAAVRKPAAVPERPLPPPPPPPPAAPPRPARDPYIGQSPPAVPADPFIGIGAPAAPAQNDPLGLGLPAQDPLGLGSARPLHDPLGLGLTPAAPARDPLGLGAGREVPSDIFAGLNVPKGTLDPVAKLDVTPPPARPPAERPAAARPAANPLPPPPPRPAAPPAPGGAHLIPNDFDPFADSQVRPADRRRLSPAADPLGLNPADPLGANPAGPLGANPADPLGLNAGDPRSPRPGHGGEIPADLNLMLGPSSPSDQGIDALFGLNNAAKVGSFDPLAGTPLGTPSQSQNSDGIALDPLLALSGGKASAPAQTSAPDRAHEIHGRFAPPVAKPSQPKPASPASARDLQGQGPVNLTDSHVFLSWEGGGGAQGVSRTTVEERPLPMPPAPPARPPLSSSQPMSVVPPAGAAPQGVPLRPSAPPAVAAAPLAAVPPLSSSRPVVSPPLAPAAAAPPGASADNAALAAALLAGLGVPALRLPQGVTPELMTRLGCLVREAAQGTLDLLTARAMMKREVRAAMTLISPKRNNPLKFSPDVGVALTHLVNPQPIGFMTPEESMRDAYEDLRSHEIGFMAGMRAALAGVLKRFDPEVLETRLKEKSMMDALLPMNRRARLWDLYTQLYRDIAAEATDDFNALFGREFVRAYEEQIARLNQEKER